MLQYKTPAGLGKSGKKGPFLHYPKETTPITIEVEKRSYKARNMRSQIAINSFEKRAFQESAGLLSPMPTGVNTSCLFGKSQLRSHFFETHRNDDYSTRF